MFTNRVRDRAFSLVELVIVIVIIGVIAAIAIPRLSRGAAGADESALRSNLAILRNAIELYYAEHGSAYPGAAIVNQLTLYSDRAGNTNTGKTSVFKYGPYIRKDMPPLPVGTNAGSRTVKVVTGTPTVDIAGGFGWIYSSDTGAIIANADDLSEDGVTTFNQF